MTLPPNDPMSNPNPSPPPLPGSPATLAVKHPPATFDPNLFPSRHRPWRQWIADHNPFLLLSTVCMLLGCYLVNSALHDQPSNTKMLALLGVINVYEACIIPLGLTLIRRHRGTARDGWWLVLFETLFLVNATFINPDFSQWWALPLNLALWLLAGAKAAILLHGLKIGISLRTFGFFALQLGIIYALPVIFGLTNVDGYVSPKIMYALWWLVGMLPLLYDVVARTERQHPEWDFVQNVIRRVYLMAPWVMLVIHLGFSHWAHHSDFRLADAAPALLGVAIASLRLKLDESLRVLARALPAGAIILTLMTPATDLQWLLPLADQSRLTPAVLVIAGTILTYGYMISTFHFLCAALAVFLMGVGYLLQNWIWVALRAVGRFILWLLPTTVFAWGVAAILAAFVLLGVGTLMSLKRPRRPEGVA